MKLAAAVVMRLHVRVAKVAVGVDERRHDRLAGQVDAYRTRGLAEVHPSFQSRVNVPFSTKNAESGIGALPSPTMSCAPSNKMPFPVDGAWRVRAMNRRRRRRDRPARRQETHEDSLYDVQRRNRRTRRNSNPEYSINRRGAEIAEVNAADSLRGLRTVDSLESQLSASSALIVVIFGGSKTLALPVSSTDDDSRQREQFAGVAAAADRDDDVLLAVQHVGHRRSGLRRRHVDRADFLAARLVVARAASRRAALTASDRSRARRRSTSVFVTSVPMLPGRPVRGMFSPSSAG